MTYDVIYQRAHAVPQKLKREKAEAEQQARAVARDRARIALKSQQLRALEDRRMEQQDQVEVTFAPWLQCY